MRLTPARLLVALLMVQSPYPRGTPDRVLGLLTLPQVFGAGACDRFTPQSITLFASPGAREPIARLQVDTYWTFHPNGGCEGLEVRVHQPGREAAGLPTEEFTYEAPAAVVVARDREWFRIRTTNGPLWLHGTPDNTYLTLVALVTSGLAHFTRDWDGSMYATPSGTRIRTRAVSPEASVRVMSSRRLAGDLWLLVETMNGCDVDAAKTPAVRAWVRAYASNGSPAVWFYSRGC